ncbi:hypothetical protein DDT56_00815 [Brenneria corticis]|uniref:Uncharacterized protein n=1 Tax=Brenneria corticis TaxID=2173106 RepID=A0A2U1UD12_9GAMM|nr:hypothetical protein DDT56_00815 [Brenneria sp. CFCC 11842]
MGDPANAPQDAAQASAASDKNAGSVFEQRLRWPGRASLRDETSIPSLAVRKRGRPPKGPR